MPETTYYIVFLAVLPLVAFLYASVGHGGASGYLALMALLGFAPETMKPTALILNLVVAGVAFYHYYKGGYFTYKLFLVFAIASIPMAFLGGLLTVEAEVYKKILGVFLIFAILKILGVFGKEVGEISPISLWKGLVFGGSIGFFSGLMGIGGGVILTPVILFLHWGKMKEAAAVSALFIWVNSASGLLGQLSHGVVLQKQTIVFVVLVLVGGFFGGYVGRLKMSHQHLKYVLAFVLALAALKLCVI